MVNLMSSNSTTGVYILEDQGGWVAGDAPGGADLDSLVLGDTYIYFDDFVSLEKKVISQDAGDDFKGWKVWQSAELTVAGRTGGSRLSQLILTVIVDSTTQANFELFYNRNAKIGDGTKYLVRQWAATTFKKFPYGTTNKNYAKVIMVGYNLTETGEKGKDTQQLNIALIEITSRN